MTLESHAAFLTYLRVIPADTCALRHSATPAATRGCLQCIHPSLPPCRLKSAAPCPGRAARCPGPAPAGIGAGRAGPHGSASASAAAQRGECQRARGCREGPAVAASPCRGSARPRCPPSPFCGPADARRLAARRGSVPCFSPLRLKCWRAAASWELPPVSSAVRKRRVSRVSDESPALERGWSARFGTKAVIPAQGLGVIPCSAGAGGSRDFTWFFKERELLTGSWQKYAPSLGRLCLIYFFPGETLPWDPDVSLSIYR